MAWAAFAGDGGTSVGDQVTDTLHPSGRTRTTLDQSFPRDAQQSTTFGVISGLIVLISATSLSRALGRMYAKAWHVEPSG